MTQDTIGNCFRKCGFFVGQHAAPTEENQEPDVALQIEGRENLGNQASARDFITADNNVAACGLRSIEHLVDEAKETESDSDSEDAHLCDLLRLTSEKHHALDVLCTP